MKVERKLTDYSLCVITEDVPELGRSHVDVARAAIQGGATVVQFREKNLTPAGEAMAREIRRLTTATGVCFIVNDCVELAAACGADGVHVGQSDRSALEARRLLRTDAVIGVSATCLAEALDIAGETEAAEAREPASRGADYVGVGPIFPTPSKPDAAAPIGLTGLSEIRARVRLPLVAIGGITADNAADCVAAGADGVAVISTVTRAPDMAAVTRELAELVRQALAGRAPAAPAVTAAMGPSSDKREQVQS